MIKAIIFDFDGVLANSKEAHRISYNLALKQFGIEISEREFSHYFGFPGTGIIKDILKKNHIKADEKKIHELKNEIYLKNIDRVKLNKNGIRLIKRSYKDYKIAVASNTRIKEIKLLTEKYKIRKYIRIILGWKSVRKHKPHPEIYIKAAKKLKVRPKECAVVEDSPYGIEAAKRAGMLCIAVLTTHAKSELKRADFVLDRLDDRVTDFIKKF